MKGGSSAWREQAIGVGLLLAAAFVLRAEWFVGRGDVRTDVLASQEQGLASGRLRSMLNQESNLDVVPVKGNYKALQAVESLGELPDLSFWPDKSKKQKDPVSDVASKNGIKLSPDAATQVEREQARAAVAALLEGAEEKLKKQFGKPRSPKAKFHAKMTQALFDYKLYKGQHGQRVHDTTPTSPIKELQVGAKKERAVRRKSLLHKQMEDALFNYHEYQAHRGTEDAKPRFADPGRAIMLRTKQSLHGGDGVFGFQRLNPTEGYSVHVGGAGLEARSRKSSSRGFECTQAGCRVKRAVQHGFSDAAPFSLLPRKKLLREMGAV